MKATIQREQVIEEIRRIIRWAMDEKRGEDSQHSDGDKRVCRARRYSYLLCAWNIGNLLK